MRTRQKLFIVSIICAGIVMGVLLTSVVATRLLANREAVRSIIVAKTAQATGGGALSYERLTVVFLPLPHLRAESIDLQRPDLFEISALRLSVYPRILPLLKGRISIRRVVLTAPDIQLAIHPGSPADSLPTPAEPTGNKFNDKTIRTVIGGLFGALSAVDKGTEVQIQRGTVTLTLADAPDIRFTDIHLSGKNDGAALRLNLGCWSTITGNLDMDFHADMQSGNAGGDLIAADLNLRPLLHYASLPGGIVTENTHARTEVSFIVSASETISSHFSLSFPELTVLRKNLKLDLVSTEISGTVNHDGDRLTLSVDTLKSVQPPLRLSAGATVTPANQTTPAAIELHAAARELDIATAGQVTRSIVGDLDDIRTAFAVAREGTLTGVTYDVRFESGKDGYRPSRMKAAGHLSQGRVTIPGIETDIERAEGDVLYQDKHVAFDNFSGYFQGAAFQTLDAEIDWAAESTLSIASTAVVVQAAPFCDWLFSFEDLAPARAVVQSIDGNANLSRLKIQGPLVHPEQWDFTIQGTPEDIRLSTSRLPFSVKLSGGEIVYTSNNQRATDVAIEFLDGSLVASYEPQGSLIDPASIVCGLDGSLGPEAVAWLTTILPIPKHLQMKPPVDLSNGHIGWSRDGRLSVMGNMKTAGGVEIYSDFSVLPQSWNIRRIRFADGRSQATVSGSKRPNGMEIRFRGNIEKETADRLLADNRTLSGRIEGDFHAMVDTQTHLNSSFSGTLAGRGVHILNLTPAPIEVSRFTLAGSGGRLTIEPSEVSLCNSQMVVHGSVARSDDGLEIDLDVDADRLDEELIRMAQSADKKDAPPPGKAGERPSLRPHGVIHVNANDFRYKDYTWNRVQAAVRLDGDTTRIQIEQAHLCGIATTGELTVSPQGLGLRIVPKAEAASLEGTAECLLGKTMRADARYDLSGQLWLPETRNDIIPSLSGDLLFSSENGRIEYSGVLMKIFSVLNIAEVFSGKSDLTEKGYGYAQCYAKAEVKDGQVHFNEILMDGNSLKLTGQGSIDLQKQEVDILLLAAPLKTVDRIVNKIPIINYIAGGSLVSIPLRLKGKLNDISVVPMPPDAVGKGLLNIMGRVLKSPFKLVEGVESFATGSDKESETPPAQAAPQPP
ncbi:AsmA-like C-terminal domain-containing protein [uncultured Desulfosarcina sp.]|uniref:YhdP family protein n=1 Tax=uncultured Desulfosarcina sp. TaxID=218289 RepID=UPI0029C8950A|nr:AsmA-like C-terminal domain-containing protein [uncultured Desulfosarcina sp.]